MSDDVKDKKDSPKGDGTGSDSGTADGATKMGFGELFGHIDSRIDAAVEKLRGGGSKPAGTDGTTGVGGADPTSVRDQLRAELAKLQGEEAAKQKEADRDVSIEELKAQVAKLSEAAPVEETSKLTAFMWGKRNKK